MKFAAIYSIVIGTGMIAQWTMSFLSKQIPELNLEGDSRQLLMDIHNIELSKIEDDELNPGMKKVKIGFRLGNGSYATMVVKQMF